MSKLFFSTTTLLFLVLLNPYVQGQDKVAVIQTRNVSGFKFIDLAMAGTAFVKQGDHFSVQIEAPASIADKITTAVSSNTLSISHQGKLYSSSSTSIKIHITLPQINGLKVSGSGNLKMESDISTNLLSCHVEGSGSISLDEVSAAKLSLQIDGSGDIRQDKATAENAILELHGSGNLSCESLTAKLVAVTLDGSGNIALSDLAASKLFVTNSGSGSVRELNGVAAEVLLENEGSGSISASGLTGASISAVNGGSGPIAVGACETLNAQITGSGSIRYEGDPKTLRQDVSGSGRVLRH